MFCSNCGQPATEGKRFCKYCGAPLTVPPTEASAQPGETEPVPEESQPTVVRAAEEQPTVPLGPGAEAAPPLPVAFVPPPPPPPPVATGYGPGWSPSPPVRPGGGHGALIAGIIAATVVVLAGIGVGTWLLVRDTGPTVTTVLETTTSTTEVALTTTTTAVTASTGSTLVQSTTTTSTYAVQDYLVAVGQMITRLNDYDARIPKLADKINQTAPDVPQAVYDELNGMMLELEKAYDELGYMPLAPGFEEADKWLDEATLQMDDRLWYTLQGIEAMWNDENAKAFFDKGREARDKYREAMKKFWEVVPAN
jgi:hypothetical protein